MSTPTPPKEFLSWLDYAIATIDARGAYLDRMFDDAEIPSREEVRVAAIEELNHLRRRATMPWFGILENWRTALSERLGRSEEVILEDRLMATDFSDAGVHIHFEDGTDLTFRRSFFLGETPADGAIHCVAVFTEHCGNHEFWIGPNDRIEVINRLSEIKAIRTEADYLTALQEVSKLIELDPAADSPQGERLDVLGTLVQAYEAKHYPIENAIRRSQAEAAQGLVVPYKFGPVAREFGSSDYDGLKAEDAVKFASDLQAWIKSSQAYIGSDEVAKALKEFTTEAKNIQSALHALGQYVSVDVAASVWIHYSESLCAGWMVGADTVQLAARTLYLNCPRQK